MKKITFILDAGHYPEQPGKRSPKLDDGRRFFEWEANYKICERIIMLAKAINGPSVIYPIGPTLAQARTIARRAQYYNALIKKLQGDALIISVHSNAAGDGIRWHPAHGIETYYFHASRIGAACATVLQNHLVRKLDWMDRGIKPTNTLALLKTCAAPVVLTETGFFTNKEQVQEMLKPEYITKTAEAHYEAIAELHSLHAQGKIF